MLVVLINFLKKLEIKIVPIYVYKCSSCGEVVEMIVKSINSEPASLKCNECEDGTLEKVPSSSVFKINGYSYNNGYSGPEKMNYDGSAPTW
jgi:putative FmdB family regulatory protein